MLLLWYRKADVATVFSTSCMAVEALLVFNVIDVPCLIKVTASVPV